MTAPTEAEIREAVQKRLDYVIRAGETHTPDWISELLDPLLYIHQVDVRNPSLWDDLPPSQVARLEDLSETVYRRADALMPELGARIVEYVVEAAMTFAAEYPDAPRAKREAIPA